MIAGLNGTLAGRLGDSLLVDVQGVVFQVHVPASTLSQAGNSGDPVRLHTYLYVREDTLALYGFSTVEERDFFLLLLTVSGVGPKSALAILSSLPFDDLRLAIASGNADLLGRTPGIGKKTAEKIVFHLKGKVTAPPGRGIPSPVRTDPDLLAALTGLGYSMVEAQMAIASLPADPDLTLEDKIRLALSYFARQ